MWDLPLIAQLYVPVPVPHTTGTFPVPIPDTTVPATVSAATRLPLYFLISVLFCVSLV